MSFKIGDIVMRMDGDKRPHKIVNITVRYPLNSKEHTFFMYHYEDGGSDVSDCNYLKPYDGKYKEINYDTRRKSKSL
jgi:hypothetical protein